MSGSAVSSELQKETALRQELTDVGKELKREGHVEYVLGTISGKLGKGLFLAKPADVDYLRLQPDKFVKINILGEPQETGKTPPSLNWEVHRACYECDDAIGGVVHAHPRSVIEVISQENPGFEEEFSQDNILVSVPLITEEACFVLNPAGDDLTSIPIVEDLDPYGLKRAAQEIIPQCNAFFIRNHGLMAVGRNPTEALGVALVLIKEAEIILGAYQSKGKPLIRSAQKVRRSIQNMPSHFRWRSYNRAAD